MSRAPLHILRPDAAPPVEVDDSHTLRWDPESKSIRDSEGRELDDQELLARLDRAGPLLCW